MIEGELSFKANAKRVHRNADEAEAEASLCFSLKNHGNVAECMRKWRTDFGRREAPSAPYFRYLVKKVKETGILIDKPKREKPKTVRTPENIAAVPESVREAPSTSIHHRSQQLNISGNVERMFVHKKLE